MEKKIFPGGRSIKSRISWLLENPIMSDLQFIVGEEEEKFSAHRFLFAVTSHDFYNGFYAMTPAENTIRLPEIGVAAFKEFLSYIYTEDATITEDNVLDIMRLADRYEINPLITLCFNSAADFMDENLVGDLLPFGRQDLMDQFFIKIIKNPNFYLDEENIEYISREQIKSILISEETFATEIELFDLAVLWAQKHSLNDDPILVKGFLGDLIQLIRFPTLTSAEFEGCIDEHQGILDSSDVIDILLYIGKQFGECKYPVKKRKSQIIIKVTEFVSKFVPTTYEHQYLIERRLLNQSRPVTSNLSSMHFSVKSDCILKSIGFYVNGKIEGKFDYKITVNSCGPRAFGVIKEFFGEYNSTNIRTKNSQRMSIEKYAATFQTNDLVLLESRDLYSITFQNKFARGEDILKKLVLRLPKLSITKDGNILLDKKFSTTNEQSAISFIAYSK